MLVGSSGLGHYRSHGTVIGGSVHGKGKEHGREHGYGNIHINEDAQIQNNFA